MANANTPTGFSPGRHIAGGVIRTSQYQIATSGTTGFNDTIRQGDIVKQNTDGTVELAAAGDTFIGIFDGVQYFAADGSAVFDNQWTASTAVLSGSTITAYVYDDPFMTYTCQMSTMALTDVGNNFDLNTGTGSSTTKRSGSYLDQATGNTTSAGFRLLRILPQPDNQTGLYAKVEIAPVEHSNRVAAGI